MCVLQFASDFYTYNFEEILLKFRIRGLTHSLGCEVSLIIADCVLDTDALRASSLYTSVMFLIWTPTVRAQPNKCDLGKFGPAWLVDVDDVRQHFVWRE